MSVATSSASAATGRRDAGRRLLGVGGFAATGVAITLLHHQLGIGVPCPMLELTGWWCPLCGSTRMASAVLDGDFGAAFAWNSVTFVLLLVLGGATVGWLVEFFRQKAPPWRAWVQRRSFGQWFVIAVSAAVVWTLARNIGRILIGG